MNLSNKRKFKVIKQRSKKAIYGFISYMLNRRGVRGSGDPSVVGDPREGAKEVTPSRSKFSIWSLYTVWEILDPPLLCSTYCHQTMSKEAIFWILGGCNSSHEPWLIPNFPHWRIERSAGDACPPFGSFSKNFRQNSCQTRMHSSKMQTDRRFTVLPLPRGRPPSLQRHTPLGEDRMTDSSVSITFPILDMRRPIGNNWLLPQTLWLRSPPPRLGNTGSATESCINTTYFKYFEGKLNDF